MQTHIPISTQPIPALFLHMHKHFFSFFVLILLSLSITNYVNAATSATEITPLSFGAFAVTSNASASTIRIREAGNIIVTGTIAPVGGASRAEFSLAGFPPNALLEVSLDNVNMSGGGLGLPEYLLVKDYESSDVTSNAEGEATIYIGATMETSGNNNMYADAPYSGSTQLRIRYWDPDLLQYVNHVENGVSITGEVQNTISLTETQAMSFGTLAAFTDPAQEASFILTPDGNITNITNAGTAELIPMGNHAAGIVRVTGAAPFYQVTITPEPGDVTLVRTPPGTIADFIATNFVSVPTGTDGTTDSVGELEIKIGATLKTEMTTDVYQNGTYSGTYTLTVTY